MRHGMYFGEITDFGRFLDTALSFMEREVAVRLLGLDHLIFLGWVVSFFRKKNSGPENFLWNNQYSSNPTFSFLYIWRATIFHSSLSGEPLSFIPLYLESHYLLFLYVWRAAIFHSSISGELLSFTPLYLESCYLSLLSIWRAAIFHSSISGEPLSFTPFYLESHYLSFLYIWRAAIFYSSMSAGLNIKKKLHKPSRASYRNFY